jgi:hypothetical protein
VLAFVLAATGSQPNWNDLAQYGVLGMVVLAFIFGKIVPGYIYERRVEEHKAAVAENQRLEETIKERVVPALIKSTEVMAQVLQFLSTDAPSPPRRRSAP